MPRPARRFASWCVTAALAACSSSNETPPPGDAAGATSGGSATSNAGHAATSGSSGTTSGGAPHVAGHGGTSPGVAGSGGVSGAGTSNVAGSAGHTGSLAHGGAAGATSTSGSAGTTSGAGTSGTSSTAAGNAGDNGTAGTAGETSSTDDVPAGYVKAIIGVGYGGIRIVSRDGGRTWGDRVYAAPDGGDDQDLLRAVAYGKGRWIATGWKLMSSDDGLHWTDHGLLSAGIFAHNNIVEGLAYKDGYFYAAGDAQSAAQIYRSADGLAWEDYARGGDTVKHTGLTVHAGVFVSYGDSAASYQSNDGKTWTAMGIDNATFCEGDWKSLADCHDAWWFDDGFYLLPEWGGQIRRSTTGSSFTTVYTDDQKNTLYRERAVAEGYVAPD
jgi:hypothetical protein